METVSKTMSSTHNLVKALLVFFSLTEDLIGIFLLNPVVANQFFFLFRTYKSKRKQLSPHPQQDVSVYYLWTRTWEGW